MLVVLLLVAVVLFTTYIQVREYLKFKKMIKDFEQTKKKKVYESAMSKSFIVLTVFVAMICVALAIYIWQNPTSVPQDDYYLYIAFSIMQMKGFSVISSLFDVVVFVKSRWENSFLNPQK